MKRKSYGVRSAVAFALSLAIADEADHAVHNESYLPKTGVCRECGQIWNKTEKDCEIR